MEIRNKKNHFITGTIGMIVVATLNIVIALLTEQHNIAVWLPLYLVFFTFLMIGAPIKKGGWENKT
jgi:hypothetical protein